MVIVYKLSQANLLQLAVIRKSLPKFIGMPNLIADKEICRELLQENATPEKIAAEIVGLLLDPDRIARMRGDLAEVRAQLGEPGGAERTARLALSLVSP
jgi:lipid-A-disaccharide synthase